MRRDGYRPEIDLRDEFLDDLAAELAELLETTGVVIAEFIVVEAEEAQERAMDVADVVDFVHGSHAGLVGGTDGVAGFHAAAGKPHRHGGRVVVAAVSGAAAHAVVGGAISREMSKRVAEGNKGRVHRLTPNPQARSRWAAWSPLGEQNGDPPPWPDPFVLARLLYPR
jgi:hypothetical protein